MTSNNADLYAALLKAGAPELPEDYYYKFWISRKSLNRNGIEHKESRALTIAIRKKLWGGLFYKQINSWYWSRKKLEYYQLDVVRLTKRGWITEEQIDGSYHLAHMALLAEDANADRLQKESKAKAEKTDFRIERIAHYLNKRLP